MTVTRLHVKPAGLIIFLLTAHRKVFFFDDLYISLLQRPVRGLDRSSEDRVSLAGGQIPRKPHRLWQPPGRPQERLDEPRNQQICAASMLNLTSSLGRFTRSSRWRQHGLRYRYCILNRTCRKKLKHVKPLKFLKQDVSASCAVRD